MDERKHEETVDKRRAFGEDETVDKRRAFSDEEAPEVEGHKRRAFGEDEDKGDEGIDRNR
jgi:hypothetical protein